MSDPGGGRSCFSFRPDWRADVPFGLLALKVFVFVGLPVGITVLYWPEIGGWLVALFIWALLGAGAAEQTVRRTAQYRRKIREGQIILDNEGARLPLPGAEWAWVPWEEIDALRLGRVLGTVKIETRAHSIAVPGYVSDRAALIAEVAVRAGLEDRRTGAWATTWWRSKARGEGDG